MRMKMTVVLWGVALLLLTACGGEAPASQTESATIASGASGQAIYEATCAACHGINGEGEANWKAPDVNGIYPAPPHDGSGHTWHHADALLLQVIRDGSGVPNSKMPPYGAILTPAQTEAVLDHIKTFWAKDEREFQQQMTQQWEALNK